MDLLLGLANDNNGIFATLFVLSALVNIILFKMYVSQVAKRLEDWRTALTMNNSLSQANQKLMDSSQVMMQGIAAGVQRLLDKEKLT